ncbi:MAG TPA: xanthine dehydrogenase family protein molybdopterin-binding subunit [Candidatus Acidoferrales bacterium]|jgi:xanthine dehydrogenase YagR molybdenum-binding subunit|nr:xanthine dehydrogenase family protein molybdopterin-binding subunit [Candidatus Acidoferrales bacterium]
MSSWPADTKYISHSTARIDAPAKLTGSARYASDIQEKGWLYGMILRSKWPSAKITAVNLDKARAIPGIKAAVVARDGEFNIRYYGEEIAAVAGTSKQACLDALRAIEVTADVRHEFVVNETEGLKADSPRVWENAPNAPAPHVRENGNVDTAFADCTAVSEGFYTTPVQIHNPMETHGNTVSWTDEGVTAWASTQGITSVRDGLAGALQLDHSKVRVITEYMGGGFGAKFGPGVEGVLAAKLSKSAGAPVRLMLTRFDQALAVGNRPSSFQKIKIGASADGMLQAFEAENYGTAGIGGGADAGGGGGGADIPMPYIYKVPNTRVKQSAVAINAGSARAFRAPGHPPASYGMESAMDDLAAKLGMDPLELRLKNDPNEIRQREYKVGAEKFGWKQKYQKPGSSPGVVKTGIGCAGGAWGGSRGDRNTQGDAQINPDGSVELRLGVQDIGTGTRTVIAVIAAEMLGLKPEQITVRVGDTNFPYGPGSGGSTTCPSVSPTVFDICTKALAQLQTQTGVADARGENWFAACKKLGVTPLTVHGQWQQGLSTDHACGVQFAEVEVDTETGLVTLKKMLGVHDCGLIINQVTLESQINGGIIMGMGYALYEERVMDDLSGVVLNPNFETYKMPGMADVPEIEIVLINMPERGVIGIGEPSLVPTAGAIANAVFNAIGVRVGSLPITPAKVLAALGKVPPAVHA